LMSRLAGRRAIKSFVRIAGCGPQLSQTTRLKKQPPDKIVSEITFCVDFTRRIESELFATDPIRAFLREVDHRSLIQHFTRASKHSFVPAATSSLQTTFFGRNPECNNGNRGSTGCSVQSFYKAEAYPIRHSWARS
jgi:hypothetical protein